MRLYTGNIHKLRGYEEYKDITIKSGDSRLAPTWNMVRGIKGGTLSKPEYVIQYKELMERSIENNQKFWLELIEKEELTLACYCKEYTFCHRYLLVGIIEDLCKKNNIPFCYVGEKR